jgi:hypothetical protein
MDADMAAGVLMLARMPERIGGGFGACFFLTFADTLGFFTWVFDGDRGLNFDFAPYLLG